MNSSKMQPPSTPPVENPPSSPKQREEEKEKESPWRRIPKHLAILFTSVCMVIIWRLNRQQGGFSLHALIREKSHDCKVTMLQRDIDPPLIHEFLHAHPVCVSRQPVHIHETHRRMMGYIQTIEPTFTPTKFLDSSKRISTILLAPFFGIDFKYAYFPHLDMVMLNPTLVDYDADAEHDMTLEDEENEEQRSQVILRVKRWFETMHLHYLRAVHNTSPYSSSSSSSPPVKECSLSLPMYTQPRPLSAQTPIAPLTVTTTLVRRYVEIPKFTTPTKVRVRYWDLSGVLRYATFDGDLVCHATLAVRMNELLPLAVVISKSST